jgi:hypothetical protein
VLQCAADHRRTSHCVRERRCVGERVDRADLFGAATRALARSGTILWLNMVDGVCFSEK